MSTTIIVSMKRIEVFGPNKSKITLDKDGKYQSVSQLWQGKKTNRLQIGIGQQEIPTECLTWAMIKAMIDAKIITVGATTGAPVKAVAKKKGKKAAKKAAPKKEVKHIPAVK